MPVGFIVDTEFVWGFQARIVGLSKTSPSFYYPPPTTFLGALACAIAKRKRISEKKGREVIKLLSENLLAIGVRPLNCKPIRYEDLNRIIAVKITSGILFPNPSDLTRSFDSPARGKTILSCFKEEEAPRLRWFLVFKEDELVREEDFWKVTRLGSKESLVSVVNVASGEAEIIENSSCETSYSFPVSCVTRVKVRIENEGIWGYEVYANPFNLSDNIVGDYLQGRNLVIFKVPLPRMEEDLEKIKCEVEAKRLYRLGSEVIVGWCL